MRETETYDFLNTDRASWFNHLLLGSPKDKVKQLVDIEGYDSSKMEIELKVNGVQLRTEDFNTVLGEWSDRIEKEIKEKLDYLHSEEAVVEKAKELLRDKRGRVNDLLDELCDELEG